MLHRTVKQAKCAMGRDAYPMKHADRIPLYMLVNMLGGPGMNSQLNLALRERYGFVYSVDAHYIPYTDTGMFVVFFGTEPKQLDKCITLVKRELDEGARQAFVCPEACIAQRADQGATGHVGREQPEPDADDGPQCSGLRLCAQPR